MALYSQHLTVAFAWFLYYKWNKTQEIKNCEDFLFFNLVHYLID